MNERENWQQDCIQSFGFLSQQQDMCKHFATKVPTNLNFKSRDCERSIGYVNASRSLAFWPFGSQVGAQDPLTSVKNIKKTTQIKPIFIYLSVVLIVTLTIALIAYFIVSFSSHSPHKLRILQIGDVQKQSLQSKLLQNSTQEFKPQEIQAYNSTDIGVDDEFYEENQQNQTITEDEGLEKEESGNLKESDELNEFNQSGESKPFDESNSTEQQDFQWSNDSSIQWPQQNQPYHIYTVLQPRLVLGIDGYRDGTLYDWNTQLYQMYYFKKVHSNFYYIINAESQQYMTRSPRFITNTWVSKLMFSKEEKKLWKLIPALNNVKNSFYIVSEQNDAVDIHMRYWSIEKLSEIILFKFQKIKKQVWILRKNATQMNFQNNSVQNYEKKLSEVFQNLMLKFESINESITLQQLKLQMYFKNVSYPHWLMKPFQYKVLEYDLPFQINDRVFEIFFKRSRIAKEMRQFDKKLNEERAEEKKVNDKQKLDNDKVNDAKLDNKKLNDEKVENKQVNNEDQEDEQQEESQQEQVQNIKKANATKQTKKQQFTPLYVTRQCANNHKVAYIWYGEQKMPKQYQYLLYKCRQNVVLLRQTQFWTYSTQWNKISPPQYQIIPQDIPIRQRINLLKLLYLYFESGIYADFDTQINENCFSNVFTNEIIFTNRMEDRNPLPYYFLPVDEIIVPEESFMMVRNKFNPQVKRMIEQKILEKTGQGDRWTECKYRQCLIVECQRHYRDNTYKKGYV